MTEPVDQHDAKRCPICGKPALARFRPFCSARCANVDLNRWLSGAYRLPAVEEAADEAVPQAPDEKQA
jgi:endogenous inhibitor of DNA gyrase (YacG/DUF329 family)